MTETPKNTDDLIDSRDVIARIEQLEDDRQALIDAIEEELEDDRHDGEPSELDPTLADARKALAEWDDSADADELRTLKALAEQGEDYAADWQYGETLIRDSYFKEYAMDLADDIGAIDANARWPANCIDWDQAARELQMDYSAIDFDGVTYWIR